MEGMVDGLRKKEALAMRIRLIAFSLKKIFIRRRSKTKASDTKRITLINIISMNYKVNILL